MLARRSGSLATFAAPPVPARISAMIASGSSDRGLSDVTRQTSASRAPISPISGRLPRSRSPPPPTPPPARPENRDHAAIGQLARGAQDVLERIRRVRVVDEDGERLA